MQWNNSAWALLQHIKFIREEKDLVTGRAEIFAREKTSVYQPYMSDFLAAMSSPKGTFANTRSQPVSQPAAEIGNVENLCEST
jgi:hypothetical protein